MCGRRSGPEPSSVGLGSEHRKDDSVDHGKMKQSRKGYQAILLPGSLTAWGPRGATLAHKEWVLFLKLMPGLFK